MRPASSSVAPKRTSRAVVSFIACATSVAAYRETEAGFLVEAGDRASSGCGSRGPRPSRPRAAIRVSSVQAGLRAFHARGSAFA